MTKEELKEKIVEILKGEKIGITITRLSDKLHVSRPTIYKYLAILKEDKLVDEVDVGGSKFWTATTGKTTSSISTIMAPYRYFVDLILETLDRTLGKKQKIDWKEVGANMTEEIQLDDLYETDEFIDMFKKQQIVPTGLGGNFDPTNESHSEENQLKLLKQFSPFFAQVFKFFLAFLDDCEMETPYEIENPPVLILHMKKFRFLKDNRIIDISCGAVEHIINSELFPELNVDISNTIHLEKKEATFKIRFFASSE